MADKVERAAKLLAEADGHYHRPGRYVTLARRLERDGLLPSDNPGGMATGGRDGKEHDV